MKGQDQQYGLTKMEIILELECGLDVEFEPDFRLSTNHSDKTKVQWQLRDNGNQEHMDDVLIHLEAKEPVPESDVSLENLRLLYGFNP